MPSITAGPWWALFLMVPHGGVFVYSNGTLHRRAASRMGLGYRHGINSNGVVVGAGCDGSGAQRGFIHSHEIYTVLLPRGWTEAYQYGINDSRSSSGMGRYRYNRKRLYRLSSPTSSPIHPAATSSATAATSTSYSGRADN